MLMESQVKFCGPQNITGASQLNSVAAFFWTTETTTKNNKMKRLQTACDPSLWRARNPKLIWKDVFYTLYGMEDLKCCGNTKLSISI